MTAAKRKTPAHVTMASLLIGTMASGMAIVLDTAGFWLSWDRVVNAWTDQLDTGMREVARPAVLVAVILVSYLLPMLVLRTPQWWRRAILWVSFTLVALAWWPVLALASWKIEPCMPMSALLWSGLCAMIYAQRHELPCEADGKNQEQMVVPTGIEPSPTIES